MVEPNQNPDASRDPDDIEELRNDTQRDNATLSRDVRRKSEQRRLLRDANTDSQDFRDLIDGSVPQQISDVEADARDDLEQQERLDVLDGLRALQTGDPITWRIYRVGADTPALNGYLAMWSTSQLTQERIKDEFGGGTYRIRGSASNGRYVGGRTVHIAGDVQRKEKDMATGGAATGFNLSEFLSQQESRDATRRKDDDARREREKRDAEDREDKRRRERNEMLALVVPAVTGLTTALVGAFAANRGPDLASLIAAMKGPDPITLLTQMKALQGSGQEGLIGKVLPMLFDMARDRASGGDTGWLDVIKEFAKGAGPAVGGLIEANLKAAQVASAANPNIPAIPLTQQGGSTIPMPPAPALPSPSMIVVPESQPRRERRQRSVSANLPVESPDLPPGMRPRIAPSDAANTAGSNSRGTPNNGGDMNLFSLMQHLPWLREQLTRMSGAAYRNRDPEVYAALLMEELPEGLEPQVVGQLLIRSDWFQQICQLEPRWNDARIYPWIEHVRHLILRSLGVAPGTVGHAAQESGPDAGTRVAAGADAQTGQRTASAPKPQRAQGDVDRPTRIPSLTGD